jgi:methylmalonyl-CoA/ethylmalonyl-CoA epimerase
MKVKKIQHIGIAVNNLNEAVKLYTDVLGLKVEAIEDVVEQKVKTAIINIGESKIELLEATSPDSTIAKFIEKNREGIHHMAVEVDSVAEAIAEMKAKGIPMIDEKPRGGVQNTRIAFVHPKGSKILLELVET